MTTAPATAAAEPRHISGGAGGAGRGLTVKVPLRLVVGAQYPDVALSTYVKIAALSLRPEGCTARVATIAAYLGTSKSSVERGLRPLINADEVDGIVELPTVRRTASGGTGESAHRVTRPLAAGELWVRIPVRAAEALTPRLLRLYALLAYASARRIPVTAAELGGQLRHHSGAKAGLPLGERQARRLTDELERTGWTSVHRREGAQGRHAYETHSHPLRAVQAAAPSEEAAGTEQLSLWESGAPVIHDGSGADDLDGSLASKEDLQTDRPENTQLVGGSRRRRGTGSTAVTPASDLAAGTFGPGASRAPRGTHNPDPSSTYTGPELRWTARIRDALAPVAADLDGVRRYLLRKIAKQVSAELDASENSSSQRIADRISRRLRPVMREDIRDLGAWLLAVGLPHRGCGHPACEDGELWPSGEPCETCAHTRRVQREQWRQAREWQDLLEERRARATAAAELPAKATFRERAEASDAEVLAAIAQHGPVGALHRYGQLRVGPLLRTADIQDQLPAPAAAARAEERPELPVPHIPGRMPDELRTAVRRPTGHALAAACPEPTCRAAAGQTCVTPRGRRPRPPHTARLDAHHPAAPPLAAASGEDTV